jgi:hypothetical protein
LKQARAFGVSIVLATQNPIDLDYRGLANIGTWLVGRLQTEQDKARIRDALAAAASATKVTPSSLDALIGKLEPRQFLLHSIHRPTPAVFKSRDALTLLRGPLSEEELRTLTAPMRPSATSIATSAAPMTVAETGTPTTSSTPPLMGVSPELGPVFEVDRGIASLFLVLKFGVRYRVGTAVSEESIHELAFPVEQALTPQELLEHTPFSVKGVPFQNSPPPEMTFANVPAWVQSVSAQKLQNALKERLPSKLESTLYLDPITKLISGPTESIEAFTARVVEKQGVGKASQDVLRKLEKRRADLAQAERDVTARKAQKWLDVGAGVLGLFGGRRSSMSSASRAMSAHQRQGGAEAKVEDLQIEVQQLESQLAAMKDIDARRLTEQVVVPKPADVQMLRVCWAFIVP